MTNSRVFYPILAGLLLQTASVVADELDDLRKTARTIFGSLPAVTMEDINDPQAKLGQALFWDIRLSYDGKTACASCHLPENWGADGRSLSINARGSLTSRHSQTVFNTQDAVLGLRWLGDRPSGADQAMGSITGSMGFGNRDEIIPVLIQYGYSDRFKLAFPDDPDPVSAANYGHALQIYQKTLRTPAAFDLWLSGDNSALNELQVRGLQRFISMGCASCHSGPLFGGGTLQRFGVKDAYEKYTNSQNVDTGMMSVTKDEKDRNLFRVQPLRNVAKTSPYFHDGSVTELKKSIDIMARIQLGQSLDDKALGELAAFMEALTGPVPTNFLPPDDIPFKHSESVR